MTIHDLLNLGIKKLTTSPSPALDSEVLLSFVLKQPKEYLFSHMKNCVLVTREKKFLELISGRSLGWPVAYLTNSKEFYGLDFYVDKNVLVPRPETEELVDLILSKIKDQRSLSILDIGTGSGNIIIALDKILNNLKPVACNLFASDLSPKALEVAKKNARRHKTKITFRQGSLLDPWQGQKFDIIVANLPYLAKETDPSTKHEPKLALIAKKDGLALFEELFKQFYHLSPINSQLFLEIGHDQGPAIKKLAKKFLPVFKVQVMKDLSGRDRFAVLTRN